MLELIPEECSSKLNIGLVWNKWIEIVRSFWRTVNKNLGVKLKTIPYLKYEIIL